MFECKFGTLFSEILDFDCPQNTDTGILKIWQLLYLHYYLSMFEYEYELISQRSWTLATHRTPTLEYSRHLSRSRESSLRWQSLFAVLMSPFLPVVHLILATISDSQPLDHANIIDNPRSSGRVEDFGDWSRGSPSILRLQELRFHWVM